MTLHPIKLSEGELRHPWILTDDTRVIDKRPGAWTNGGRGWQTRAEAVAGLLRIERDAAQALAALAALDAEDAGRFYGTDADFGGAQYGDGF